MTVNELPPHYNIALNQAWLWMKAVEGPTARLLGDGSGLPDALLLLVALRNVKRAAVMSQKSLQQPGAVQILTDALAAFDEALPGLKDARDVIEHFDEYTVGASPRQQRNGPPGATEAELASFYETKLDGPYNRPTVRVGSLAIEVAKVPAAAALLFRGIWEAADAEDGQSTI